MSKDKLSLRLWFVYIIVGLAGQLAWAIENMYLNTYITYLNFEAPAGQGFDYSLLIAVTTASSAIVATLTTIFIGALTDKVGHRKYFIAIGYLIWGITTAMFGLFNVDNDSSFLRIAVSAYTAAVLIVVLDCVMTFFGSTANDAAFNAYVTENTPEQSRGKVEGVLQVLSLLAMLIIFVGFNNLTTKEGGYRWDLFFYILGGLVMLVGLLSFFLIPKEKIKPEPVRRSYLNTLKDGFRPTMVKKNPSLYLLLLSYFVFACACQIFFPYLLVYVERSCKILNSGAGLLTPFAIVMAVSLLGGSLLSVIVGLLGDKVGKSRMIFPSLLVFALGVLMMFFIPDIRSEDGRTVYACFAGLVMIAGYVGVPTILNSLIRSKIPAGEEGTFMGVRMIFVVALPMCIGPFIGDALNENLGETYTGTYGVTSFTPTRYDYLVALGFLLLILLPLYFYFRLERKQTENVQ